MSTEDAPAKLVKKYPFLARNWLWIILALLIIGGFFYTAYSVYKLVKGAKKE